MKRRMNKKGSEGGETGSTTINTILSIVVFALVAGIFVAFALYGKQIIQLLPGFGNETVVVKGVEKLRYVVTEDQVQYYDSNYKWKNFGNGEQIQMNDKIIKYEEVKQAFVKYYFFSDRDNDPFKLEDGYTAYFHMWQSSVEKESGHVVGASKWDVLWGNGKVDLVSGDVLIDFVKGGKIEGYVYLSSKSGQLIEVSGIVADTLTRDISYNLEIAGLLKKHPAWLKSVSDEAESWRDSVFSYPMSFSYYVKEDKKERRVDSAVCVEKWDRIYLIADLRLEVSKDEVC